MQLTHHITTFGTNLVGYSPLELTIDASGIYKPYNQRIARMKYIFGNGEVTNVVDDGITNPENVQVTSTYYLSTNVSTRFPLQIDYWYYNTLLKNTGIIYIEVRPPNVLKTSLSDNIGNFEDIHLLKIKSWKDKNMLVFETVNPNTIFVQKK